MAGNVEIQGIEFQVVGEASKAADGLKPLISSLRRLKRIAEGGLGLKSVLQEIKDFNSALGSGETPLTGFANAINQIASSGRKLGSVHSHLEGISQLDFSNLTTAAEAVSRIAQSAGGLRGITGRAGRNTGSNLPALTGARDSGTEEAGGRTESGSVEDSFRAASEAAHSMFSNLDRDTILSFSRIDMLIAKLDILKQRMDEGLAATGKERPSDQEFTNLALQIKAIEEEIDKLNQKEVKIRFDNAMAQFNKFIDIAKRAGKEIAKFGKQIVQFSSKMFSFPFRKITSDLKKTISAVNKFMSSIGRIAMYRLVRTAIASITKGLKEGIEALDAYSEKAGTSFHKAMQSIHADAQWLKGSLAAAAAPIIEALAPALDFLASKVAYLLSLIAQLVAALSGRGVFTRATKNASSFGSAAGGAAKEMRMLISGFDELNAFSKSSGGGGGGGGGAGIEFEEYPISEEIAEFARRIREAFEQGDWEKLGRILGEKVNEIFDSIDWAGIGKKLGKAIDGVIRTMYSFLKTVDFVKIGRDLAEMLNNALAQINFNTAGRLLIRKFTAMLDMLVGFIMNADWGLIAKSIGDFLRGAFDEAAEWLASTDFAELGRKLSDAVKKILDQLIDAASHIPWVELGQKIGDFLCSIDWGGVLSRVVVLILEVAKGLLKGLFTTSGGWIILGFKALSLIPLAFKVMAALAVKNWIMAMINPIQAMPGMVNQTGQLLLPAGQNLVGALTKGILMGVAGIAAAFWGIKDALMNGLNWLNGIVIPAGTALAGAGVGTIIGSLGGPIGAGMGAIIGLVIGGLIDLGIAIKEHWAEISAWITEKWSAFTGWVSEAWGNLTEWTTTAWTNICNAVSTAFGAAVDWVTQAATDVGTWVSNAWTTICEQTSITWENVKQMSIEEWTAAKEGISQAVTDVGNWISTTWTNVTTWTTTAWTNVKTAMTTTFTEAKTAVCTAATEAGNWINNTWNNIRTWTSTTWNNVKTTATTAFNNAKNSIVSTANTMKSNLSNTWNNIKSTASSAWESVKSTAISKWQTLSSTLSSKWQALRSALGSLDFTSIGRNLVQGLMNGVGGAWSALVSKVQSLAQGLISKIKGWFGVHSPSTVFADIGINLDAGLEQGIEWGTESLLDTANTIAGAVSDALTPDLPNVNDLTDSFNGGRLGDTGLIIEQENEEGSGYLAAIAQVVDQMFTYMRENQNRSQGDLKVVIDGREVFNVVVAENNRAIQRTGASPIRV